MRVTRGRLNLRHFFSLFHAQPPQPEQAHQSSPQACAYPAFHQRCVIGARGESRAGVDSAMRFCNELKLEPHLSQTSPDRRVRIPLHFSYLRSHISYHILTISQSHNLTISYSHISYLISYSWGEFEGGTSIPTTELC